MRTQTRLLVAVTIVASASPAWAEVFLDAGLNASRVDAKIALIDNRLESSSSGWHLGVGARRTVNEHSDIGVRLELDDIDSNLMFAVRALDYRRRLSERLAVTAFAGAARLDLATPAYGYYFGAGVELRDIAPRWDLGIDLRFGDELARDNVLPSDPKGGSPDNFYSVTGLGVYLSYRF